MAFTRAWDETVPTDSEHCGHGASRIRDFKEDVAERVHAARPLGALINWPSDTIPDGWLECDGSAISRTTYAGLFALISTKYGNGDGLTTFNIPDLRGLFIRGKNGSRSDAYCDSDSGNRYIKKTGVVTSGSPVITGINGTGGLSIGNTVSSISLNGDITNGSPIIKKLKFSRFIVVGAAITGTGIPSGSKIISVDSGSQVTISNNATATALHQALVLSSVGAATHINSIDSESQVTLHDNATISGTVDLFFIVGDSYGSFQFDDANYHRHWSSNVSQNTGAYASGAYVFGASEYHAYTVTQDKVYVDPTGSEFVPCNIAVKIIIKSDEL